MNRLPGIAAVALIVLGGATSSVSPSTAGGLLPPRGVATVSAPASSSLSPMKRTAPAPAPVQVLPEIQVKDASVKPAGKALPAPARIRYPAIKADLPASEVGIAEDGAMEVPDDAAIAGWYRYSAAPSDKSGSTRLHFLEVCFWSKRDSHFCARSREMFFNAFATYASFSPTGAT